MDLQCICPEGWIGNGDFVSGSPACQLNIAGVRAVWSLVLIFHTLNFFLSIRFLLLRPKRAKVLWKDFPLLTGLCSLASSACLSSLGYVRVFEPIRAIGTDAAATLLFAFGSALFWTWTLLMVSTFVELLAKGLRARNMEEVAKVKRFVQSFRLFLPIAWVFSMFACIAPMFILVNPANAALMYGLAACHFVVLALVMAVFTFLCFRVISPLEEDLDSVLRELYDSRLASIRWKVGRLKVEVRNQGYIQAVSAGIFGLWPYAQRYSSYELAIA